MTPEVAASELLSRIGKRGDPLVTSLSGGRNNRVWRIDCDNQTYLLKHYFWSESDPRDRLGQEWAFLRFLHDAGCRKVPEPIAKNSAARYGLFEFISGEKPTEIFVSDIQDAADFLYEINIRKHLGIGLPPVSEAAFSIEDHVAFTARRVENLTRIPANLPENSEAVEFVKKTLNPLWQTIRSSIERLPVSTRTAILPLISRCLSPSDFGFHNALRQSDGSLRYLDFEYAGWDDPAKTLIDFTNQPDRILSEHLATLFLEKTIPFLGDATALRERIFLLTPVYQLKWACICLNAFLPGRPRNPECPLASQLARARASVLRAEGREE